MKTTVNAKVEFTELKVLDEQGCNSRVYLAKDHNLDAEIIIKEMKIESDISNYLKEAQILYSNTHPNIVKVQYAATDENNVYIGMPYYQKGSLEALMKIKNLTSREIIRYSIQFLTGLHHIHSNGLIHFDIKPNNILLSDRNEAMLSDFGLSKNINDNKRASPDGNYIIHLPPETFQGGDFSFTYDIYQAGLTMYRLCLGSNFFINELNHFIVDDQFNVDEFVDSIKKGKFPLKKYPIHINKKLQSIINKCLSINPDERYQSSLDLLNALANINENDKILDWQQKNTTDKQKYIWVREDDKNIITVTFDTLTCKVNTVKLNKLSGKKYNLTHGNKNSATHKDVTEILKGV